MADIIDMDGQLSGPGTEMDGGLVGGPGAAVPAGDLIKESDTNNFPKDVIEASETVPVIIDFWAPWCEPCKQLGPVLERLVREYAGAVKMVKINVDDNQGLAQQMRVQSIPMVVAFSKGRPVDAFQGALPESQLKQFIEKLTGNAGSPVDQAMEGAKQALDAGDIETAISIYNQVFEAEPENETAVAGIARCYIAAEQTDAAKALIDGLPDEARKHAEIAAVISALELVEESVDAGETTELANRVAEKPNDHQARFDLAVALYGQRQTEPAIDELLEIISRNQKWNDDAARKQLLKIFEALGFDDPVTVEGRRRLSAILFS